jgi:hypothetical protein
MHLELSSIVIVGTIVVHEVDELKVVTLSTLVIVRIMSWGDLHGTGTKVHVDGDGVGDDGNAAVDERVHSELAMEVLVKCDQPESASPETRR